MFDLNVLLRKSWLASGRFDGNQIVKDNFHHFLHRAAIFLSIIASAKAFCQVLKPSLKFYLIELYMTDGVLVQSLFNIGASFIHLSMVIKHVAFYKFNKTPKRIAFLKYLLFKTPKDLEVYYEIDKEYVEQFFKLKNIFWHIANKVGWLFIILLEALVLRCTVVAIVSNKVTFTEFIFLTIPFSIVIIIAYYYSSYSAMTSNTIFLLNCIFIELRLKDLCKKLDRVIRNSKKDFEDQNKKIYHLIIQMNSILKFYNDNQYLGDRTVSAYYLTILLIFLFYPYMMFFEKNTLEFQIILILGYTNTFISQSLPIVIVNSLLNKRVSCLESLNFA